MSTIPEPQASVPEPSKAPEAPEAAPREAPPVDRLPSTGVLGATLFLLSGSLVVFELLLTRLFSLIMFAHLANLAIALALLGIGIGATVLHLFPRLVPPEKLAERLGQLALLTAVAMLVGTILALNLQLNDQWDYSVTAIRHWNRRAPQLIHKGTLAALMPFLMLPFVFGGLGFSAIFKVARARIGKLYAADLWGGALGSALFIPALQVLSGPDTVLVTVLGCSVAAAVALRGTGKRAQHTVAIAVAVAAAGAAIVAATGVELLKVRYTAGYAEKDIYYTEWTPEARLSLHDDRARRRQALVLDTSSASEIVRGAGQVGYWTKTADRALAFKLRPPPGRVAVIAASAGNEVATAQRFGYRDVTAIDIAGRIFGVVREKFAKVAVNPYLQPGVRTLDMDGRAGIVHSGRRYAIIMMRWANLNNAAGIMSNAWSPSLLETKEAFVDYLTHLEDDGLISFAKGSQSVHMVPSAVAALRQVGQRQPYRSIALVEKGHEGVLLVRRTPFPKRQVAEFKRLARAMGGRVAISPGREPRRMKARRAITDDRPYRDTPREMWRGLKAIFQSIGLGDDDSAWGSRINMVLWLQALFLIGAGLLFVGLPLVWRGRRDMANLPGKGSALGYASAIGYAYLAIETVLIHDLILFVGHPTYAITLVVLVMLLGSGIGSARAGSLPADGLARRLKVVLLTVVGLALVQALVLPALYGALLVGTPMWLRIAIVGLTLLPLAYFMGMPFPIAMRLLPASAGEIVPWCWALNGWMSVVAAMATVFFARQLGYVAAFCAAIAFYLVAMALSGGLERVGIAPAARTAAAPAPEGS
ncbi:MAG: hypothetical protein HYY06_22740 [Deltaproteobacteria bacterium]|nr:hypothetical protein [Deltaproteobacteria bacterium]